MHPSIPRVVGVAQSTTAGHGHHRTIFESVQHPFHQFSATEDDIGVSGTHYGDLIRNLLMTSCSAPVTPQMLGPFHYGSNEQWNERYDADGDHHHHHSAMDVSNVPSEFNRPSAVAALRDPDQDQPPPYWFTDTLNCTNNMDSDPSLKTTSQPSSVHGLSPPPTSPTINMDVATLRQIDEFEELIEKIDRLNDIRTDGNAEAALTFNHYDDQLTSNSTTTTPVNSILFTQPDFPSSSSHTASATTTWSNSTTVQRCPVNAANESTIDNDLETLLEQNPSLLDIPSGDSTTVDSDCAKDEQPRTFDDANLSLKCDNGSSNGFSNDDEQQCQTESRCDNHDHSVISECRCCQRTRLPDSALTSPVPTRCFGPPTSLKSATMTTRTNLKQLLQMQQFHEMERKEQTKSGTTSAITGPPVMSTTVSVPMQPILPSRMEVPSEVLKVHSRLENPTRYHVQENQKRQVQEYLSTTQGNARSILVHSVPNAAGTAVLPTEATSSSTLLMSSSAPSPGSPNSVILSSSAATSVTSEADVIESIMQLESSMDVENAYLHHTATLPTSANFMDILKMNAAKSCPPDVQVDSLRFDDNQLHAIAKDRQKKDNHNMIERRRRFNINDRIKELGTLLPRSNDPYYDMIRVDRQNKGTILKATVDYVKQMKRELERVKLELGEKDQENRKLRLQNVMHPYPTGTSGGSGWRNSGGANNTASHRNNHQQMAAMQTSHSTSSSGGLDSNWPGSLTGQQSSAIYRQKKEHRVKEEPIDVTASCDHHLLNQQLSPYDDLMDEDEPVHGDPMLSSSMLGNTL